MPTLFIGADHRGFDLKQYLVQTFRSPEKTVSGWEVVDAGPAQLVPDDDYPQITSQVSQQMLAEPDSRAVLVCGSGVGVTIAANKVRGVRAALGLEEAQVARARAEEDINVLTLAADTLGPQQAETLVKAFVTQPVSDEERHHRRRQQLVALDNQ